MLTSAAVPTSQALAALKDAVALEALHLHLSNDLQVNDIGDGGAQSLATLNVARSLHTLHLDLGSTRIGVVGVQAMAALKDAMSLRTLHLDLRYDH